MKNQLDHPDGMRRNLLRGVAGFSALAASRIVLPVATGFAARDARAQAAGVPAQGTHLVLLGTQGGPNFNPIRGESANVVVVDGRLYMVDCGYGAMMALRRAGLNFREVGHIFLTHLHDDHTGDVAAMLSHQWSDGRISPTVVIGPYGTDRLVQAASAFGQANADIRLVDEARSVRPADIFSGRVIEATPSPIEVHADEHVRVAAVENTHFPEGAKERMPYRSVSYRIDSRDRSIAFSGDTAYSEGLVELARGADVLVCEVIEVATMRQAFERMVAGGAYADNPEGIWKHIVETHTPTEDAGRMAAAAGIGTLVLSHLVPGALIDVEDAVYLEGVRRHFDGQIIVGSDLMVI